MSKAGVLLLTALLLMSHLAIAQDSLYGPEWTFTNNRLINKERLLPDESSSPLGKIKNFMGSSFDPYKELHKWVDNIREACPNCRVENISRGPNDFYTYRISTPDGYWFQISQDSWVHEVTAKPLSAEETLLRQEQIQKLVWDTAYRAQLYPHWRVGGGHIHIDYQAHFAQNPLLLRNFIVDLMNHPELFMGALALDYLNAPPLAAFGKESTEDFKFILSEFDKNKYTGRVLMSAINRAVYRQARSDQIPMADAREGGAKYHAISFGEDHLEKTLELRGLRPQENAKHYGLMVQLFEARIAMLRGLDHPLKYLEKDFSDKLSYRMEHKMEFYETSLDPEHILKTYESYVEGAGLDPGEYLPLITKELREKLPQPPTHYFRPLCTKVL